MSRSALFLGVGLLLCVVKQHGQSTVFASGSRSRSLERNSVDLEDRRKHNNMSRTEAETLFKKLDTRARKLRAKRRRRQWTYSIIAVAMVMTSGTLVVRSLATQPLSSQRPSRAGTDTASPRTSLSQCGSAADETAISCNEAIVIAERETGFGAKHGPFAVLMDYRRNPGADPIDTWFVTFHGISAQVDGVPGNHPCAIGDWLVIVDASSGAVLQESSVPSTLRPCSTG